MGKHLKNLNEVTMALTVTFACLVCLFGFGSSQEILGEARKEYYWFPDLEAPAMTRSEAEELCSKHGMKMASVRNAEEQSVFNSLAQGKTLNGNQGYNFWTQGVWDKDRKEYFWNDKTPLTFKNWYYPDSEKIRASTTPPNDYVFISSTYWAGGTWGSTVDTNILAPLCERTLVHYYKQ